MTQRQTAIDITLVIAAIVAGWAVTRLALYPALGIPENFPAILKPILGFLAATAVLYQRGSRWECASPRTCGSRSPARWRSTR